MAAYYAVEWGLGEISGLTLLFLLRKVGDIVADETKHYDNDLSEICSNCKDFVERKVTIYGAFSGEAFTFVTCEHALDCEKLDNDISEEGE